MANPPTTTQATRLATQPPAAPPMTVAQALQTESVKQKVMYALASDEKRALQFIRQVQNLLTNPDLAACELNSFLGAMLTAAHLDLAINTNNEAWIIPFKERSTGKINATFVIGYKGLMKLFYNSRYAVGVIVRTVYEGDEVKVTAKDIEHTIRVNNDEVAPKAIGYYARWTIENPVNKREHSDYVFMSVAQIKRHRDRYSAGKNSKIWQEGNDGNFDEMAEKTVLRMALKMAPLEAHVQDAVNTDNTIRTVNLPDMDKGNVKEIIIDQAEVKQIDNKNEATELSGVKEMESLLAQVNEAINGAIMDDAETKSAQTARDGYYKAGDLTGMENLLKEIRGK